MIFGDENGDYVQVTIPFKIVTTSFTLSYYKNSLNYQIAYGSAIKMNSLSVKLLK